MEDTQPFGLGDAALLWPRYPRDSEDRLGRSVPDGQHFALLRCLLGGTPREEECAMELNRIGRIIAAGTRVLGYTVAIGACLAMAACPTPTDGGGQDDDYAGGGGDYGGDALSGDDLVIDDSVFADGPTLAVPSAYATIQEAIDSAADGATVVIADGTYDEALNIDKTVRLVGSGSQACIIHSEVGPVVSAEGVSPDEPVAVHLEGVEITGGAYNGVYFYGVIATGVSAVHVDLVLRDVVVNNCANHMVQLSGGSLTAESVTLQTRDEYQYQCDVGMDLDNASAVINHLVQDLGKIDHTVNINQHFTSRSSTPDERYSVEVKNSRIRSSQLSWGDCVRSFVYCDLEVRNCVLYRPVGGDAPGSAVHSGIGINGYGNTVTVAENVFDGIPWGMFIYGSLMGSNVVVVEYNEFKNLDVGLLISEMHYEAVDAGGGSFGSAGENVFRGNREFDIRLRDDTPVGVSAIGNEWSNSDPDAGIWDQLDDANLGRVAH